MEFINKIGIRETTAIILIATITKMLYFQPALIIKDVGTGIVVTILLSGIIFFGLFWILWSIYNKLPQGNLFEISNRYVGKTFSRILGSLLIIYFIFISSADLRELIYVIRVYFFDLTPYLWITGSILLIAMLVANFGINGIARVSVLCFMIIVFAILLCAIFDVDHYNLFNLTPILGYGVGNVLINGLMKSSIFSDLLMVFLFSHYLTDKDVLKKSVLFALAGCFMLTLAIVACHLMSYNYNINSYAVSAILEIAEGITIHQILHKLEPLLLIVMSISTPILLATRIFVISEITKGILNLTINIKRHIFNAVTVVLIFIFSLYPKNIFNFYSAILSNIRNYEIAVFGSWLLVFLLGLLYFVNRRKRKTSRINQ